MSVPGSSILPRNANFLALGLEFVQLKGMPLSPLFASQTPVNSGVPISDGSGDPGASLDAWVSDGSGGSGVCYVPLTTGAEPVQLVSNGAGALILVPFTP